MMTRCANTKHESIVLHNVVSAVRNALVFICTMALLVLVLVPSAIAERGYFSVGGEWLLIICIPTLVTGFFAKK